MTTYVWAWPQELVTICSENGGPYPQFSSWVSDKSNNEWYKYRAAGASTVSELSWVNDMPTNNGGNNNNNTTATLGHVKETVYADTGIKLKDLKSALESNLTNKGSGDVTYYYKNYEGNWDVLSTQLYNPGNRRIKAVQGGQSTEFDLYIYGTRFKVSFQDANGWHTYGLAHYHDRLALKTYDATDPYQQWVKEDAGDDYFYLKNLGSGKYVVPASGDYWRGVFVDLKPTNNPKAMFRIDGYGYKPLFLKENPGQNGGNMLGYDLNENETIPGDDSTVFLNKGGNSGDHIINWEWPKE